MKCYNNSSDQDLTTKKLPISATELQQVTNLQIFFWLTLMKTSLSSLAEMVLSYYAIMLNLPITSKTLNRKA